MILKKNDPFIANKCKFYNTTLDKCDCGNNSIYSAMFWCDIPCAHRHFLGKEFPDLPDIELELTKQFNEFIPDIQEDEYTRKKMENDYVIKIITQTIKKYSHSKFSKDEIKKYVNENYHPQFINFVQGYPIEFFTVISNGIEFFSL